MASGSSSSSSSAAAAASLRRLAAAAEGFAAQLQCAICLCAYASPASLPCNHCFCEECIHRALELKPECPICKAPATKRRLRDDAMIAQLLRATALLGAPAADAGGAEDEEKPPPPPVAKQPPPPRSAAKADTPLRARGNGRANQLQQVPAAAVANANAEVKDAPMAAGELNGPFVEGQLVEVVPRMWVGVNKPGGAARVTKAYEGEVARQQA